MAAYYSESGYCAEDAMRRPYGEPGYLYGEGDERYAVHKEIDEVARAGRGHYGHGHQHGGGHLGHSGSGHHHHHVGGHLGEQHRVHGHGHAGGRPYDACESSRYDSCSGEYYA